MASIYDPYGSGKGSRVYIPGPKGDAGPKGDQGEPGPTNWDLLTNRPHYLMAYDWFGTSEQGFAARVNLALAHLATLGGGILNIPAGNFEVETTILLPSHIHLRGMGAGVTVLKAKANLNAIILRSADDASPYDSDDITISDLTIDGNRANQTPLSEVTGIKLYHARNALIRDVVLKEIEGHGIHLSNVGATIEGQRVVNVVVDGVGSSPTGTFGSCFAVTNGTDVAFQGCRAYDSFKAGFRLSGTGFTLAGCEAKRNGNGGVVPVSSECTNLTITGGVFADSKVTGTWKADGIRLVDVDNVTITGAICSGNDSCGIAVLNGCRDVTIIGVQCFNNGKNPAPLQADERRSGIAVYDSGSACSGVTIIGCHLYDDQGSPTQDYGLEIANLSAEVNVEGCRFGAAKVSALAQTSTADTNRIGPSNRGLSSQSFTVGDTALTGSTATTNLFSHTIKANAMGRRGKLKVSAFGTWAGAAGTKTMSLALGGSNITFPASAVGASDDWWLEAEIVATGTGSARVVARMGAGSTVYPPDYSVLTVDTTADWVLALRGKLSDAADTIILRSAETERVR